MFTVRDLVSDEIKSEELLTADKAAVSALYPEAVASGKPFLQAAGRNRVGTFLKITQFKKVIGAKASQFTKATTVAMVSTLVNADIEVVGDLEIGMTFEGQTLATVQTLDRSLGFPVLQRNGLYGHKSGQPVYESHELVAEGTADTLIEGLELVGEELSRRESAELIIAKGVARRNVVGFTPTAAAAAVPVTNPFLATTPMV
jgi:hypothetical protein